MGRTRAVSRRTFSGAAALALLGGASLSISCGGGGPAGPSAAGPASSLGPGDKAGSISANHGHVATITAAQLAASGAVTLQIRGQSDHPHSVDLSAGQVAAIAAGTRVSVQSSSDDAHAHTVTFN